MIKFALRPNLKYPLQLIIWSFIRSVERELIGYFFSYKINLIYLPLMFFGEFFFGLIIFLYQKKFYDKKKAKEISSKYARITLIDNSEKITLNRRDEEYIIMLLIIFNAFFDFVEFVISIEILPKFINSSSSIELRLNGLLIIIQALLYKYLLGLPILKHQSFSLIINSICLALTIITEFIYQDINIFLSYGKFLLMFLFLFFIQLFNSLLDLVDKYLFEYNYVNPFQSLMLEGLFGLLYSLIYCIYNNPFPDMYNYYYNNNDSENFGLLIFLLVLYCLLCGGQNSFRVYTNKIYSPMAATLSQYFLNPIYIIFSLFGNDFIYKGKRNYIYFSLNMILSTIISLSGCVYNEFLILFFCGLYHETHDQIVLRANTKSFIELNEYDIEEEETPD